MPARPDRYHDAGAAKPFADLAIYGICHQTEPLWLRIPNLETNPVRITEMDGSLLTLQANNSNNIYLFDTLARQFVDSARQVLETATPAPTFVVTFPPPTPTEIILYP